ncbi:MAG TPA: hypothetical protein PLI18_14280 [Pirellulaceae bacterium]|nr:hypothetical protein [Pirellulaceae bacterium]
MTTSQFEFHAGAEVFRTGLIVPPVRPLTFARYAESGNPMFSFEQIRDILADPSRTPARKQFPSSIWIGRQINNGCNGWAGAGGLGRARVRAGHAPVVLSGDGLYAQISGGRDGGSMLDDGMQAMQRSGIPPQDLVRIGIYHASSLSTEARAAMSRFRGFECYRVDEDLELASGLAAGFIGVVAVHYSDAYRRLDSTGLTAESLGPGNHAVGVQDLRIQRGELQYDSFNSHGRSYGQDGCNWISWRRHLAESVRYHAFYLIRSASADPQADNPPVPKR